MVAKLLEAVFDLRTTLLFALDVDLSSKLMEPGSFVTWRRAITIVATATAAAAVISTNICRWRQSWQRKCEWATDATKIHCSRGDITLMLLLLLLERWWTLIHFCLRVEKNKEENINRWKISICRRVSYISSLPEVEEHTKEKEESEIRGAWMAGGLQVRERDPCTVGPEK